MQLDIWVCSIWLKSFRICIVFYPTTELNIGLGIIQSLKTILYMDYKSHEASANIFLQGIVLGMRLLSAIKLWVNLA